MGPEIRTCPLSQCLRTSSTPQLRRNQNYISDLCSGGFTRQEKGSILTSGTRNVCGSLREGLYSTSSASALEGLNSSPPGPEFLYKYNNNVVSSFFDTRILPRLLVFSAVPQLEEAPELLEEAEGRDQQSLFRYMICLLTLILDPIDLQECTGRVLRSRVTSNPPVRSSRGIHAISEPFRQSSPKRKS